MSDKIKRPDFVKDFHLTYLDELRKVGQTNMFGAVPYLQTSFNLDKKTAKDILIYWMKTFSERHAS